jgi:hypothetical protein
MKPETYCKKIVFNTGGKASTVLYGIILEEDTFFLKFRTAHKIYSISKQSILVIEGTDITFHGDVR